MESVSIIFLCVLHSFSLAERTNRYVRRCKAAYNVLRKNANLLINLFHMMLATGIPELREEKDIEYLRTALALDMSDEEASKLRTILFFFLWFVLLWFCSRFEKKVH